MRTPGDAVALQLLQHSRAMDAEPLGQITHSGSRHVRRNQLRDFRGLQSVLVLSGAGAAARRRLHLIEGLDVAVRSVRALSGMVSAGLESCAVRTTPDLRFLSHGTTQGIFWRAAVQPILQPADPVNAGSCRLVRRVPRGVARLLPGVRFPFHPS